MLMRREDCSVLELQAGFAEFMVFWPELNDSEDGAARLSET
jgi:hypothetical protein